MKITKKRAGEYKVSHPNFNEDAFGGELIIYRSLDGGWKTSYTESLFATKSDAVANLIVILEQIK